MLYSFFLPFLFFGKLSWEYPRCKDAACCPIHCSSSNCGWTIFVHIHCVPPCFLSQPSLRFDLTGKRNNECFSSIRYGNLLFPQPGGDHGNFILMLPSSLTLTGTLPRLNVDSLSQLSSKQRRIVVLLNCCQHVFKMINRNVFALFWLCVCHINLLCFF